MRGRGGGAPGRDRAPEEGHPGRRGREQGAPQEAAAAKEVDAAAPEVQHLRDELAEKTQEIPRTEKIIVAVTELRAWLAQEAEEMDAILANCTTEQRVLDEARAEAPREPLARWALAPDELFSRIRKPGVGKRRVTASSASTDVRPQGAPRVGGPRAGQPAT